MLIVHAGHIDANITSLGATDRQDTGPELDAARLAE